MTDDMMKQSNISVTKLDRARLREVANKRGMSVRSMVRNWAYKIYQKEFGDREIEVSGC